MKTKLILSLIATASLLSANEVPLQQGWNLKGTSANLTTASFDNECVETVWQFKNNKWQAYSPKIQMQTLIEESVGIQTISSVDSNDGFWVLANSDCNIALQEQNLSTPPLIGTFIDSPVANMDYNTSSGLKGTTNGNGNFQYHNGDNVEFSIGNLVLGTSVPNALGLVTPPSLADNNDTVNLILQTLQSVDIDNNATNGINIDSNIKQELKALNIRHHINSMNEDDLLKLHDKFKSKLDKDGDGHIDINKNKARKHFDESMEKLQTNKQNNMKYNQEYKEQKQNRDLDANEEEKERKEKMQQDKQKNQNKQNKQNKQKVDD